MLNLAGSSYDFGQVLFAVLQECEHRRRGLLENEAGDRLMAIAREKLAEIRQSYIEAGGGAPYWKELEKEVLDSAMPQYVPAAVQQTRLERSNYDLWRGGDAVARGALCLGGLALGGLIIAAPFIPIWEDAFAFVLAGGGFFWPEIKRTVADFRHSRVLNRLIVSAEKYQRDGRIHYVSSKEFDEALRPLGEEEESEERAGEAPAAAEQEQRAKGPVAVPNLGHPGKQGRKAGLHGGDGDATSGGPPRGGRRERA